MKINDMPQRVWMMMRKYFVDSSGQRKTAPKKKWSEEKKESHRSEPGVIEATHMT